MKMKKMSDEYPTVSLDCDCESVDHIIRFQYWNEKDTDDQPTIYISSPMRIQNVWRRFRAAAQIIVWGEVDSGLDVLWGWDQAMEFSAWFGHVYNDMRMRTEKEFVHEQQGGSE